MRFVAIVLSVLALASCSRDPRVVRAKYLESGNKYFDRGRYKEASIMYRKALAKDPRYGEAYYRLSKLFLLQGQLGNAVGPLRRAIELLPYGSKESNESKMNLAEILLMASDNPNLVGRNKPLLEEVDRTAKDLLKQDPNSFDGHKLSGDYALAAGLALYADGKAGDAKKTLETTIAEYRTALKMKPDDPKTLLPLARTLMLYGETADAQQIYKTLTEKDPHNLAAFRDLYRLFYAQHKMPEAEEVAKKAAAANPKDYGAQTDLAGHYFLTNNMAEMTKVLDRLKANHKEFPDSYIIAGNFYTRVGRNDDAVRQYEEGIQNDPKRKVDYQKRIIESLVRQNKPAQAYDKTIELLKENPKDTDARSLKASFLLDRGDVDQAVVELQQVVTANPENFVAAYNLGRAHVAKGEFEQARQSFERVTELRPDYLPARQALAQMALTRGDNGGALKYAQDLERLNKNSGSARLIESAALVRLGKYDEARKILDALVATNPNHPDVLLEIGVLDLAEKKYPAASVEFHKAYLANPKNVKGLLGEAETLLMQRKPADALQVLADASAKQPDNNELKVEYANMEVRTGQFDKAITDFQGLSNKLSGKQKGDVMFRLGQTYVMKGDLQHGIDALRQAASLMPNDPAVLNNLAVTLDKAGQHKESRVIYESNLKNDPNNPVLLNNLAFLLAETGGDLNAALTYADRAKQRMPDMWEISDTIGWIYLKKNLADNAVETFRELTAKQPDNPIFHYHYCMALAQKGDKAGAVKECKSALEHHLNSEDTAAIKELLQKSSS